MEITRGCGCGCGHVRGGGDDDRGHGDEYLAKPLLE